MSRERAQAWLCQRLNLKFPYHRMGVIDSLHLFAEPETQLFAMYEAHKGKWFNVLDIGANLGLHSIILARCGFNVRAYEPDFEHFDRLLDNLEANGVMDKVHAIMAAVHTFDGEANFVRVLNNLTGNHLVGYKDSYGPRSELIVPTVDARSLWAWADFAKIDCEGNEAEILVTTTPKDMQHLSAVVEVRNEANAHRIYKHFRELDVPMWSEKRDWQEVKIFGDMPKANREGPLYVGMKGPWE